MGEAQKAKLRTKIEIFVGITILATFALMISDRLIATGKASVTKTDVAGMIQPVEDKVERLDTKVESLSETLIILNRSIERKTLLDSVYQAENTRWREELRRERASR